jgi:hypothetical protein
LNPGHGSGGAPPGLSAGRWLIERYEELRTAAGRGQGWGQGKSQERGTWGRAVLIRRGMAEWARVCSVSTEAVRDPVRRRELSGRGEECLTPRGSDEELVRVLAGMVWRLQTPRLQEAQP